MLNQVKLYVNEAFREHPTQIRHFERTLYWLQHSHAEADEAFQIAAYAHDIERATREERISRIPLESPQGYHDPEFLKHHQEHGANIITEYLISQAYPEQLCDRVYNLVSRHEVGGDFEQNLLMDSDSLSFFETQVDGFITRIVPKLGTQKVWAKFDWMFNRISDPKIQTQTRHLYESAIHRLLPD